MAGKETITCRAAIMKTANGRFEIETVQVEPPKEGEVRVKMSSAGVCHSDQSGRKGIFKTIPFPMILGHEGAGVVESVGPGVTDLEPGDGVVFMFEGHCGKCKLCKDPRTNRCLAQRHDGKMMDDSCRIFQNGNPIPQFVSVGVFSEYVVASEINVVKVDKTKVPLNRVCLLGCCIPTGYGAAVKCAAVRENATCAIWGIGGVGLNVGLGCRDRKASKVIGIDINEKKFDVAKKFGFTDFINSKKDDVYKRLQELTDGGPDYCFVSVGIRSVMEEAVKCSNAFWGETILIGLTGMEENIEASVWGFLGGKKITGTLYGSYKAKLEIPSLADKLIASGACPLDDLVSHVLPFDKINEGFDLMMSGDSIRTVLDFSLKS